MDSNKLDAKNTLNQTEAVVLDNTPQPILEQPTSEMDKKKLKRNHKVIKSIMFITTILLSFALGALIVWYFLFDGDIDLVKKLF